MTVTEVPELVPARMLNEYAYCPRLFFLEWVDQLWAPSSDTAEGDRQHRRVDAGGGAAPLPAEGEVKAARSVELSSEQLGIIAQAGSSRGHERGVVPGRHEEGSARAGRSPWEADAVQVCAQVLLLREHGYTAERGEIFYAETRQRVPVEITPELIARTLEVVGQARATATRLAPPPPLRSSPKCPRCSLAGICLPDEMNVLAGRQHRSSAPADRRRPRRGAAVRDRAGLGGGRRRRTADCVQVPGAAGQRPPASMSCTCALTGTSRSPPKPLRALFERDVDVFHFSYGGWLLGLTTGLPSKNVMLRIRQVTTAARGPAGRAAADDRRQDQELPGAAAAQRGRSGGPAG